MLKIRVADAAALMNKNKQFLRVALQRNLVPFGFAVKLQEGGRYDYFINSCQFAQYLGITEEELENYIKRAKEN